MTPLQLIDFGKKQSVQNTHISHISHISDASLLKFLFGKTSKDTVGGDFILEHSHSNTGQSCSRVSHVSHDGEQEFPLAKPLN